MRAARFPAEHAGIKAAGSGIPDMVKKWTEAGYGRPMLSERMNPERSSIFLPPEKEADISSFISSSVGEVNLNADQRAILNAMANDPSATYPAIAQMTGFSESKVYRLSSALQEKGIVERVGSRKAGTWKVLVDSSMLKKR